MSLVRDLKHEISCSHCQENSRQVEDIQNNCQRAVVWPSKQVHPESRPKISLKKP